jgi:signal peptidase I
VSQGPSGPLGPADATRPTAAASEAAPKDRSERSPLAFLRELPVLIVLAFALAILLKTFVVQAFFIPSGSMEPVLRPGDRVLVNKIVGEPARFDVVVFADPNDGGGTDRGIVGGFVHWVSEAVGFARPEHEDFIKRVIGLPGEVVEIRAGRLLIDGARVAEPYLEGPADTRDFGPVEVPRGSLFVLGDNRLNSNDSRFGLGFVPVDKVIGRAFVIIWPPSRAGWVR